MKPLSISEAANSQQPAIISACAGSGKTWVLAVRIIDALLRGIRPQEILAISFTRKAAREISNRVTEWLEHMAVLDNADLNTFLLERGISANDNKLNAARQLFGQYFLQPQAIKVHTFHAWYLQLLQEASYTVAEANFELEIDSTAWLNQAWGQCAEQAKADNPLGQAWLAALDVLSLAQLRQLVKRIIDERISWQAAFGNMAQRAAQGNAANHLAQKLAIDDGNEQPEMDFFYQGAWPQYTQSVVRILSHKQTALTATQRNMAETLAALLLPEAEKDSKAFAIVYALFFTKDGKPRSWLEKLPTQARQQQRFGSDLPSLTEGLQALTVALMQAKRRALILRAYRLQQVVLVVAGQVLDNFQTLKAHARIIDYTDSEALVWRLLSDSVYSGFLAARLDQRYRAILIDEFQDTNPVQWRILNAWLSGYGMADAAMPSLFIVGDPKQTIYRFRGADTQLFDQVCEYLTKHLNVSTMQTTTTRRCAQPIVEVVNQLFASHPEYHSYFEPHATTVTASWSQVRLYPLINQSADGATPAPEAPLERNPLTTPYAQQNTVKHADDAYEAAHIAQTIAEEILGRWAIDDPDSGEIRPAHAGDIMILAARRKLFPLIESELLQRQIPYVPASRNGLLATQTIQDVLALLRFLHNPVDRFSLAVALRSPLFACSHQELWSVIADKQWPNSVARSDLSPTLQRAATLLQHWLARVNQLPVHDIVEMVFTEGEVFSRFMATTSDTMRLAVQADLCTFIEFSLAFNRGRYSSLTRFLALLDEDDLSVTDALSLTPSQNDGGRIRLLTIHGAKGLSAPIVWLADSHVADKNESLGVYSQWPVDHNEPTVQVIHSTLDKQAECDWQGPMAQAQTRERLNLLYVALTRARQVLLISGQQKMTVTDSWWQLIDTALTELTGTVNPQTHDDDCSTEVADTNHSLCWGQDVRLATPPVQSGVHPTASSSEPAIKAITCGHRERVYDYESARLGELWHAIWQNWGQENLMQTDWWRAFGFSQAIYRQLHGEIATILAENPLLSALFSDAHVLNQWREQEWVTAEGNLLRLDVLIETRQALWLLDYKYVPSTTADFSIWQPTMLEYLRAAKSQSGSKPIYAMYVFADGVVVDSQSGQTLNPQAWLDRL